jgi:hypothetical protein
MFVVSRNVASSGEWRSSSACEAQSEPLLTGVSPGANRPGTWAFKLQSLLFARLRKRVSRVDSLPDVLESPDSPFETQEPDRIDAVSDIVRPPLSLYGVRLALFSVVAAAQGDARASLDASSRSLALGNFT